MPWTGTDFSDRDVGEIVIYTMDFSRNLATGEQILTAVAVMLSLDGNDPNPADRLSGAALINTAQVSQVVTFDGLVLSPEAPVNRYRFMVTVTTSLNQQLTAWSHVLVADPTLLA